VVAGSLSLRNHLAVRDVLRSDRELRRQYAAVKRQAGATAADIDEYGHAKPDRFIAQVPDVLPLRVR